MRPIPVSPHAWSPRSGPSTMTPSAINLAILRRVAGFSHISRFIAGATSNAHVGWRARTSVESRSLAIPLASLARKSALAGATRMASAERDNSICAMLLSIRSSQASINTGLPDNACIVTGVINFVPASVITTCTSMPAFFNRRVNSADL